MNTYSKFLVVSLGMVAAAAQAADLPVDTALYLSASAAQSAHRTVIDVRPAAAYLAGHIPGALNLPLAHVKAKTFLASSPIMLVDEGWGNPVTENECQRLIEAGFKSVILFGGLETWRASGGILEGPEATLAPSPVRLAPAAFATCPSQSPWILVNTETNPPSPEAGITPSITVDWERNPRDANVKAVARLLPADGLARLLVFDTQGEIAPEAAVALTSLRAPVFVLDGGVNALVAFRAMSAAMLKPGTVTIESHRTGSTPGSTVKPCADCP